MAEEELKRQLEEKEKELDKQFDEKEKELNKQFDEKEKELQDAKEREKELQDKIQKYEANIVNLEQAQQMKEKTIKNIRISGPTFKFGTTQLSANGKEKLKDVTKEIQKYPEADILIEGHTDNIGSDEVNQKISEERASAIATTLKKDYGVKNDIYVIGRGKTEPIASNDTSAGRAKNRRVEIIITTAE